jgi:hypothetical protein
MTTDRQNRNQRRSAAIAAEVIGADDAASGITLTQPDRQIDFVRRRADPTRRPGMSATDSARMAGQSWPDCNPQFRRRGACRHGRATGLPWRRAPGPYWPLTKVRRSTAKAACCHRSAWAVPS